MNLHCLNGNQALNLARLPIPPLRRCGDLSQITSQIVPFKPDLAKTLLAPRADDSYGELPLGHGLEPFPELLDRPLRCITETGASVGDPGVQSG